MISKRPNSVEDSARPIHDWSRVPDGMFHWFHQRWIGALSDWLNQGRLPEGYYAIGEIYTEGHIPDVLTVEGYLARKNLLAIRTVGGTLVAVIEIVSPGNKSSEARMRKFVDKTVVFLGQGVHVLVIDLFPPTPRDPHGIHEVIWREGFDGEFVFQPDKPLTVASYLAAIPDNLTHAYVEPTAVGEPLPAMPLFLMPTHYVSIDLEATYAAAWAVYPEPLKPKVENPDSAS